MFKFVVVSHWRGKGKHLSEVRILTPDRMQTIVASQPTGFEILPGGFADNITFFVEVVFPQAGEYWVQTLINSNLYDEQPLLVADARTMHTTDDVSEAVN